MDQELERLADRLDGSIALIDPAFEPFSTPRALVARLESLSSRGVKAAVCFSPHFGRRMTLMSGSDWHDEVPLRVALPIVQTAREHSGQLQRILETCRQVSIDVESEFSTKTSWNCMAEIPGNSWPDESIVLAAHHDTTPESPGANDNAAGDGFFVDDFRGQDLYQRFGGGLSGGGCGETPVAIHIYEIP